MLLQELRFSIPCGAGPRPIEYPPKQLFIDCEGVIALDLADEKVIYLAKCFEPEAIGFLLRIKNLHAVVADQHPFTFMFRQQLRKLIVVGLDSILKGHVTLSRPSRLCIVATQ